jgi:hypothetical protein
MHVSLGKAIKISVPSFCYMGARGSVVGWGAVLQAGKGRGFDFQ